MLRALVSFLLLLLTACHRPPEWYPPPEQQHAIALPNPTPGNAMVDMSDPDVADHIVSDIGPAQGNAPWRWTQKRPTVKVLVLDTQGLKFLTDFSIWDGSMKETGPVTISFFIGDKLLDRVTYPTAGFKHFEKPVNPEWLQTVTDTVIAAEVDKIYTAPLDGVKFGFILTRMGLVPR